MLLTVNTKHEWDSDFVITVTIIITDDATISLWDVNPFSLSLLLKLKAIFIIQCTFLPQDWFFFCQSLISYQTLFIYHGYDFTSESLEKPYHWEDIIHCYEDLKIKQCIHAQHFFIEALTKIHSGHCLLFSSIMVQIHNAWFDLCSRW